MRSKKSFYNILSNVLLQFTIVIYGFIVPKIVITNFGSEVNGLVASITQFLGYITFLESGFGPVVKASLYKPIANKDQKTISGILLSTESFFKKIAYIFILYIVILCFLYPIISKNNFSFLFTASLIVIISISTFSEYFFGMTYRLFLHADQKSYVVSSIQIVTYIISIMLIVFSSFLGLNIHLIKLIGSLSFVLRPLIQNHYIKKHYSFTKYRNIKKCKINNKWDGLAQHIAAIVHNNTDMTILTIFSTLKEVSVYSVYILVVKGIRNIIQSLSSGIDALFGDMIAKYEHDNLNKKFNIYETVYFAIVTIIFCCTFLLITPFIKNYTITFIDVNYIRYTFGYLLVISEYIWAIRLPYSSITLAAGHFKETRKGAWVEAISNIVISIVLVIKYGLVGVAIGTIVAMTIRTIEFIYHTNKYILKRNMIESFKKVFLIVIETCLIVFICKYLPYVENVSYVKWIINALMTGIVSVLVVMIINIIVYKNDMKSFLKIIKRIIVKK